MPQILASRAFRWCPALARSRRHRSRSRTAALWHADGSNGHAAPGANVSPARTRSGPDSLPQDGVPKGKLEGPLVFKSQILAGTVRRYWIYVPAQYTGATPANVLVFQDGQRATNPTGALRVPQVLENLIHKKDIPVHDRHLHHAWSTR